LINWLNSNQGFSMTLLTLVYVVATIVIVYYNRKSIEEVKQNREEENRPYVFVNLHKDPRDLCFYLRVRNYGKTTAKIENISVDPPLKLVNDNKIEDLLKDVILVPGQLLQFIVLEESAETSQQKYSVDIKYNSVTKVKKTYEEKYKLILQYSELMGYTDTKRNNLSDRDNALKDIANYLDSIRSKI